MSWLRNLFARHNGRPLDIVGAGALYCAWVVLGIGVARDTPQLLPPWNEALFLIAGALAALAALFVRRSEHARASALVRRATLVTAVVSAVLLLVGLSYNQAPCATVGVAGFGAVAGLFEITLFCRVAELSQEEAVATIAVITLASAVLGLPLVLLPTSWSYTLFALAPLACLHLLWRSPEHAEEDDSAPASAPLSQAGKILAANLLVTLTFNLMVGEALASLPGVAQTVSVSRLVANVLASAALLVYVGISKPRSMTAPYRVVLPTMMLGLLLLNLIPAPYAPLALVCESFGYALFDACIWIVLASIAIDRRSDGFGLGALYVATTLGGMAMACLVERAVPVATWGALFQSPAAVLVTVLALLAAVALILPESLLATLLPSHAKSGRAPDGGMAPNATNVNAERLDQLARQAALTAREREVLALLARGRTTAVIAREIGVAGGTAHTHVAHIYTKLGVHNQQELIDLVEQNPRL